MKAEIKDFLAVHTGVAGDQLNDETDLFANEIWDSLLIVRFVHFAEQKFGVKVDLTVLNEDKIRSVRAAADFLATSAK